MKTKKIFAMLVLGLLISGSGLFAQGPPPPPVDPEVGGGPVGGPAPIGAGLGIMLTLAAAYGGAKVYRYFQSEKEELED